MKYPTWVSPIDAIGLGLGLGRGFGFGKEWVNMQNVVNSNSPENMLCYKQKYSIQNILLKPDRQSIVDCDNNALVRKR